MNKDLRKILDALEAAGFTVRRTTKGHYTVGRDGHRITTLPGTPSDHRSMRNALAKLKPHGFT